MLIFILSTLLCPKVEMINQTKIPWDNQDYKILGTAHKRCGEIYPEAPCVKKFYKRPEQSYWVICGN